LATFKKWSYWRETAKWKIVIRPIILSFILSILEKSGYTVRHARNGREALSDFSLQPCAIHLLLTDVVMPRMSGPELGRKLKEICPELKILYMSGYAEDSIVHHGILDSEIDLIQKPFSADGLLRKIREVHDG